MCVKVEGGGTLGEHMATILCNQGYRKNRNDAGVIYTSRGVVQPGVGGEVKKGEKGDERRNTDEGNYCREGRGKLIYI